MSVFLFIVGTLLLLDILWAWHADVLLRRSGRSWRARVWPPLFALAMCGLLALLIFSRGTEVEARAFMPVPLVAALYIWHLVVLPVWLVLGPVSECVRVCAVLIRRCAGSVGGATVLEPSVSLNRRGFIGVLAAAAPPVALSGLTGVSLPQMGRFRVRRIEVPLEGLPAALDGLTIAQVSDAHVGVFTNGPVLDEIARTANRLEPDLVMLTGDLINNDLADLPEAVAMVESLRSRYGVILCEGNHDLIPGPNAFARECKAAGLNLLVNEAHTIAIGNLPVQILGLRWGRGGPRGDRAEDYAEDAIGRSMKELLRLRDPEAFPILLAHHPHAFDPAVAAGIPLTLAGHTHGGQLMVNERFGFGPALYRYWSGLYRSEKSALVVSNGVGNWFPLRTAAPAEILHLTLRKA